MAKDRVFMYQLGENQLNPYVEVQLGAYEDTSSILHRHLGSADWHVGKRLMFRKLTKNELLRVAVQELY